MTVSDVFKNIPVRLAALLKAPKAEWQKCMDIIVAYALSSRNVRFIVVDSQKSKNTVLQTDGSGHLMEDGVGFGCDYPKEIASTVSQIFGVAFAKCLVYLPRIDLELGPTNANPREVADSETISVCESLSNRFGNSLESEVSVETELENIHPLSTYGLISRLIHQLTEALLQIAEGRKQIGNSFF